VKNGILTLRAREDRRGEKGPQLHRIERRYGSFYRALASRNGRHQQGRRFVQERRPDRVDAKREEAKPKSIAIKE